MSGSKGIISVFAKPPRPGEVKTRLAASIGDEAAARMARAFLADTWRALSRVPQVRLVLASTTSEPGAFELAGAELWPQGEGDLGARLERVGARALAEAPWWLAVGADSPGLPLTAIEAARAALLRHDAVLGPAADGGYYLLGLRRLEAGLLSVLPWSTPRTLEATRDRLHERGYSVATVQPWFDVDEMSDLDRLRAEFGQGTLDAPRTAEALAALKPC